MIYFSNNLKFLRSLNGLKQGELALKLNVKTNTISNYENGISQPDFKILEKIVQIFDIKSSDLLFRDLSADKTKTYSNPADDANLVSEPEAQSILKSNETCKNCTDKERIISALQTTIEEFKKDKDYLKEEIKELKERLSSLERY